MAYEYLLIAELPEPYRTRCAELRQFYDQWSKHWLPPHVTLLPPLRTIPEALRQQASSLVYPVEVTFGQWFAFRNPGANVVWLDPGQAGPGQVCAQILQRFPELTTGSQGRIDPAKTPTYHITIAGHIPDDQLSTVYNHLKAEPVIGHCRIERLSLFQRELPEGKWQRITTTTGDHG